MPEKNKDEFLSFEKAVNKLNAEQEKKKQEIHQEAQDQAISVALPKDRNRYLMYCISLLERVDGDLMARFPVNIQTTYTGREMANLMRMLLRCKIGFATNKQMAHHLGVPINIIDDVEFLARIAVQRAIIKRKKSGIPIVGL